MCYPHSIFLFAAITLTCASKTSAVQDKDKTDSAAVTQQSHAPHSYGQQIIVSPRADTSNDWHEFISLFPDTISDTLQLFMYEAWIEKINEYEDYAISKEKYAENLAFKGKVIDKTLLKFIQPGDLELQYNQSISYYAVNRIVLDSHYTYVAVRLYSDAAPHIIDFLYLYVFDKNYRLLDKILVADLVGDDGFSEHMQSWVIDLNHDGTKEIITRTETTSYDGDHEDMTTSLSVRKFSAGKFAEEMQADKSALMKKFVFRDKGIVDR